MNFGGEGKFKKDKYIKNFYYYDLEIERWIEYSQDENDYYYDGCIGNIKNNKFYIHDKIFNCKGEYTWILKNNYVSLREGNTLILYDKNKNIIFEEKRIVFDHLKVYENKLFYIGENNIICKKYDGTTKYYPYGEGFLEDYYYDKTKLYLAKNNQIEILNREGELIEIIKAKNIRDIKVSNGLIAHRTKNFDLYFNNILIDSNVLGDYHIFKKSLYYIKNKILYKYVISP